MTQLNINLNLEELIASVNNSDMNELMKAMAVTVFNACMEAERDEYIQAQRYERHGERADQRNGYYERDYTMSIGKLKLRVPRTRNGGFSTQLFSKYKRMDQAFVLGLMESVINGVSTRKVTKIVEQLCGESISKSCVSEIMKQLDPIVDEFRNRSLTYDSFRYIYVDAVYIKVHEENHVVSKAVYIAQGVNSKDRREVLGLKIGEAESEQNWRSFLQSLRTRGMTQPKMIISDAHSGLVKAIREEFPGTKWQRCTAHFIRNITDKMPNKGSKHIRQLVSKVFRTRTLQEAKEARVSLEAEIGDNPKYQSSLAILDDGFMDALQYLSEPESYHISLRTTNSLERLNLEIRRREQVIKIFPNEASGVRLIGAVLMDYHEKWEKNPRPFLRSFDDE
ncbi:MAG TPA: IS256 family transposase [Candidatus Enterococcus avicola]|uniref:Mutator family transposase n=1 Tax=Candidatus Enterococcus avicola TaxID=2838561 RepID=A0A9D2F874_9ENTE|nr:IS256 family transposase [Candidatus Enterococcus avicola]